MSSTNLTDMQWGVCHIFASNTDTFVHVTDITGSETIARITGGQTVKVARDCGSAYAAMRAAAKVAEILKSRNITHLHVNLRGKGGTRTRALGQGASSAMRQLAREGIKIGHIQDVTPIPTDSTRVKCGRRGRRL